MSKEHPWLQDDYSAEPFPVYAVRCKREGCTEVKVCFDDAEARNWQEAHTQLHEFRANQQRLKQELEDQWAAQGGRPVKIQKGSSYYARYVIKDADRNTIIISGLTVEEAIAETEKKGWRIVGMPRGYKPEEKGQP